MSVFLCELLFQDRVEFPRGPRRLLQEERHDGVVGPAYNLPQGPDLVLVILSLRHSYDLNKALKAFVYHRVFACLGDRLIYEHKHKFTLVYGVLP